METEHQHLALKNWNEIKKTFLSKLMYIVVNNKMPARGHNSGQSVWLVFGIPRLCRFEMTCTMSSHIFSLLSLQYCDQLAVSGVTLNCFSLWILTWACEKSLPRTNEKLKRGQRLWSFEIPGLKSMHLRKRKLQGTVKSANNGNDQLPRHH